VDLRPRPQQDGHAFAWVVAADEHDPVLPTGGIGVRRDQHTVRDQLVVAGEPARSRFPRSFGDGDPDVDTVHEEAPDRLAEYIPRQVAVRVEGRDDRALRP
jgi:hypothetical protein